MQYFTHRKYKRLALCGQVLNIPYGTVLETDGDFLFMPDGRQVCAVTSEEGARHFARNDDGNGAERGALTWAIAYEPRTAPPPPAAWCETEEGNFRFSAYERDLIQADWGRFLKPHLDFIVFNSAFFAAAIDELEALAAALNIQPKRR